MKVWDEVTGKYQCLVLFIFSKAMQGTSSHLPPKRKEEHEKVSSKKKKKVGWGGEKKPKVNFAKSVTYYTLLS